MNLEEKEKVVRNMGKLIKEYLRHLANGEDLRDILLDNLLEVQGQLNGIEAQKIIQKQ